MLRKLSSRLDPLGAGIAASFLLLLAPLLSFRVPPIDDFANHLVRYWLLSGGADVPPVSGMYAIDWTRASTNIGLDAFSFIVGPHVSFEALRAVILVAGFAGPPAGAALLNRIVFKRSSAWLMAIPMLAWTTTAVAGFMSYQVAIAAALLAACLDVAVVGSSRVAFFARPAAGVLLLLLHPFGLAFYCALIVAISIGGRWNGVFEQGRVKRLAWGAASSILTLAVPLVLLLLFAPTPPYVHSRPVTYASIRASMSLHDEVRTVFSPVATYDLVADAAFALPFVGAVVAAGLMRRLRLHAGLIAVGLGLALLSLVMPERFGDATWINRRVPLMAALTIAAGLRIELGGSRVRSAALVALLLAAGAGKTLWIDRVWTARERDARAVARAISNVPAGAAVFTVDTYPARPAGEPAGRFVVGRPGSPASSMHHLTDLAVMERHAFIPTLFSVPGQQPLRVLPPWRAISTPTSPIPDVRVLERLTDRDLAQDPYLEDWPERFDYVVWLGADMEDRDGPVVLPPTLELVADEGYARLYRVATKPRRGSAAD